MSGWLSPCALLLLVLWCVVLVLTVWLPIVAIPTVGCWCRLCADVGVVVCVVVGVVFGAQVLPGTGFTQPPFQLTIR